MKPRKRTKGKQEPNKRNQEPKDKTIQPYESIQDTIQRNKKTTIKPKYNETQTTWLGRGKVWQKQRGKERGSSGVGGGAGGPRTGRWAERRVAPPVEHGEPGQDATRHYLPSVSPPCVPPSLPPSVKRLPPTPPPSVSFPFLFLFPFPRSFLSF